MRAEKGSGISDEGSLQGRGRWQRRQRKWQQGWWESHSNEGNGDGDTAKRVAIAMAMRLAGDKEGKGKGGKGNGNGDESGGQQKG
jgi:hypothetical protein